MARRSNFRLSSKQIAALEVFRDNAREAREMPEWLRASALLMVATQNMTREAAAAALDVSARSIFHWQFQYENLGLAGLRSEPGTGKARRLTPNQLEELRQTVKAGPVAAGYESGIWTSPQLAVLIEQRFGVKLSTSQVRRTLHFLNLSQQYPKKKLAKADRQAQEKWRTETLPGIHDEVEKANGVLLYEDEAAFEQAGTVAKTWAPVGEGIEVKSPPSRFKEKAYGAVNVTDPDEPKWHFRFAVVFNALTVLAFLQQLVRAYPGRKVFLVMDNAPCHHANIVKDWLAANKERIQVYFLPPYSPELNAAEWMWRLTRRKNTHNKYFETKSSLRGALRKGWNRFQGNPASMRSSVKPFSMPARKEAA